MIEQKKKLCKSCHLPQYIFSRGRCKGCASKEDYKPLRKISNKTAEKKFERSQKLSKYFYYHLERVTHSEESGVAIPHPTRANVCHIFPKRKYKSVEDNILNCVYLTFQEHTDFDRYLDTHNFEALEKKFSNSWEKVCKRAEELLPLITETGRFKEKFEEYLKNR